MRLAIYIFLLCLVITGNSWGAISYGSLARTEVSLALDRVGSASLFEEPWLEAPWPTDVITGKDLRRFGWETLAQVLEYLPSFYRVQDFNKQDLVLRGVYFAETSNLLFLEDGFRLNSPGLENFLPFWNYPLWDVSRIEVVRGPGSSLYGDAALSGVISTKRTPLKPGTRVGLLFGDRGSGGGWINWKGKRFWLMGAYFDREGKNIFLPSSEDSALVPAPGVKALREIQDNYHFGLGWDGRRFSLLYRRFRFQESGAATLFGENLTPEDAFAVDPQRKTVQDLLGLGYRFPCQGFHCRLQVYFTRAKEKGALLTGTEREFPLLLFQTGVLPLNTEVEYDFRRYGLELLAKRSWPGNQLLLGGKLERTDYHSIRALVGLSPRIWSSLWFFLGHSSKLPAPVSRFRYSPSQEDLYALFAEWKTTLRPNLYLNLGLRYEHFEAFGGKLSPRVSLILRPSKSWSSVLTFTRAYQSVPYFFRVMHQVFEGNKSLEAQKSDVLSVSLRYRSRKGLYLSGTVFYQWLRDYIRLDPSHFLVPQNIGNWEAAGLELEARYHGTRLSTFVNYSFYEVMESRTPEANWTLIYGRRVAGVPRWMVKGGVSFLLLEKPRLYISPLFRKYGRAIYKNYQGTHWAPHYLLIDLNLLLETGSWFLSFKVENLFDQKYLRTGFLPPYPQTGRSFSFKLERRF